MIDVLFAHSYFLRFDPKQWKAQQPFPPLATIYAASVLRNEGWKVDLFDTMFSLSAEELTTALDDVKPKVFVIYDDGFNYLTKMCLTNMRDAAFRMMQLAKERGITVIVSSSDATDHSEDYLRGGADYVIFGEGELTLKELISSILNETVKAELIAGLRFLKDGQLVQNAPRKNATDLDQFPLPAWDLVDMEAYRNIWLSAHDKFILNMVTTRGCPFKCNWCA